MDSSLRRFCEGIEAALAWLESFGVRVDATRFRQYVRQVQEIVADEDAVARTDDPVFTRAVEVLEAGAELCFIHRHLEDMGGEEFVKRLKKYVAGTYFQRDENPATSSNRARNLGFELYFAAQLARAGFRVEFGEGCDIRVQSPEMYFECKRPQTGGKVESGLRQAKNQLMSLKSGSPSVRVIAISIGKALHRGEKLLVGNSEAEVEAAIDAELGQFRSDYEHVWQDGSFAGITGIWFHCAQVVAITRPATLARKSNDRILVFPNFERPELEAALRILADAVVADSGLEAF